MASGSLPSDQHRYPIQHYFFQSLQTSYPALYSPRGFVLRCVNAVCREEITIRLQSAILTCRPTEFSQHVAFIISDRPYTKSVRLLECRMLRFYIHQYICHAKRLAMPHILYTIQCTCMLLCTQHRRRLPSVSASPDGASLPYASTTLCVVHAKERTR